MLTYKNQQFFVDRGKKFTPELVPFTVAARLKKYADPAALVALEKHLTTRYALPANPLPRFLDPHQVEGIQWALTRKNAYLAHAPGAGKTLQAITTSIYAGGKGPTLFIVPPTLTANWAREIYQWIERLTHAPALTRAWPAITIVPETKHRESIEWRAQFIICPDSMLTKPWVLSSLLSLRYKLIAVDEASRFKEVTAERSRAFYGGKLNDGRISTGFMDKARHILFLDGSPMPNRPMELWAPCYHLAPESIDYRDQNEFGHRYCAPRFNEVGHWEFKGASFEDELKAKIQKSFMHVVPESGLRHPERLRSLIVMTKDARSAAHRKWEQKHLGTFKFSDVSESDSQGELAKFRRELGLRKVKWIASYTKERLDKGDSILLFAWHREVIQKLADELKAHLPGVVLGGTSSETREKAFRLFQKDEIKLIIGNISSMGRGHNLQRASRIIFGEYSWTDETNKQAEKRASRKGSTRENVKCDYIVSPNSIDEMVLRSLFTKEKNVRKIIGE